MTWSHNPGCQFERAPSPMNNIYSYLYRAKLVKKKESENDYKN